MRPWQSGVLSGPLLRQAGFSLTVAEVARRPHPGVPAGLSNPCALPGSLPGTVCWVPTEHPLGIAGLVATAGRHLARHQAWFLGPGDVMAAPPASRAVGQSVAGVRAWCQQLRGRGAGAGPGKTLVFGNGVRGYSEAGWEWDPMTCRELGGIGAGSGHLAGPRLAGTGTIGEATLRAPPGAVRRRVSSTTPKAGPEAPAGRPRPRPPGGPARPTAGARPAGCPGRPGPRGRPQAPSSSQRAGRARSPRRRPGGNTGTAAAQAQSSAPGAGGQVCSPRFLAVVLGVRNTGCGSRRRRRGRIAGC